MKTKLYIAYGSNMDMGQMAYRCPEAKLIGTANVADYRLLFKGSQTGAYATIEPAEGYTVPVLVWEITEGDEQSLDRYEGFPTFYYKENLTVLINDKQEQAMVYIMDESRPLGKPSLRYYKVIQDAYAKFNFDMNILTTALEESMDEGGWRCLLKEK